MTIKISEQRQWRRSGVFVVNLEHISLVFLLLTLNIYLSSWLDIRVSFNDCLILFWLSSLFEIKLNKRVRELKLVKLLLIRSLHLKILFLQHFFKISGSSYYQCKKELICLNLWNYFLSRSILIIDIIYRF